MEIYTYRVGIYPPATGETTPQQLPNLEGFEVEALDGKIGKVDEATYDAGSSCVVVDTGFWIFGKKRMIPANMVDRVDRDEQKLYVRMTKDQIKDAPDYDPDRHRSDEQGYHKEVGDYYEPYGL